MLEDGEAHNQFVRVIVEEPKQRRAPWTELLYQPTKQIRKYVCYEDRKIVVRYLKEAFSIFLEVRNNWF